MDTATVATLVFLLPMGLLVFPLGLGLALACKDAWATPVTCTYHTHR